MAAARRWRIRLVIKASQGSSGAYLGVIIRMLRNESRDPLNYKKESRATNSSCFLGMQIATLFVGFRRVTNLELVTNSARKPAGLSAFL